MAQGPLTQAEWIRVEATIGLDPASQSACGQFFTPERAAALIADMVALPPSGPLRVLDPGAGSGMLTAALVERVCRERPGMRVDVVAIELDPTVVPSLRQTASLCEDAGRASGSRVTVEVVQSDAITALTGLGATVEPGFDVVIMNLSYHKLGASSPQRRALLPLGWECPNLYAAFLALGVEALRDGGQMVAITPRSFANGPSFAQFRRRLLAETAIT